jgi:hypothetical protein
MYPAPHRLPYYLGMNSGLSTLPYGVTPVRSVFLNCSTDQVPRLPDEVMFGMGARWGRHFAVD